MGMKDRGGTIEPYDKESSNCKSYLDWRHHLSLFHGSVSLGKAKNKITSPGGQIAWHLLPMWPTNALLRLHGLLVSKSGGTNHGSAGGFHVTKCRSRPTMVQWGAESMKAPTGLSPLD